MYSHQGHAQARMKRIDIMAKTSDKMKNVQAMNKLEKAAKTPGSNTHIIKVSLESCTTCNWCFLQLFILLTPVYDFPSIYIFIFRKRSCCYLRIYWENGLINELFSTAGIRVNLFINTYLLSQCIN